MIYVVREVGFFRSRVKIGYTTNLKRRLSDLRGASPSKLRLLLSLPGSLEDEHGLHERFADYRLRGEWFRFGLRLFVFLNQFKYQADTPDKLEGESEEEKAKYHPDNVNEAIDKLLTDTPDSFPTKTDVAQEVDIVGGSKYGLVMGIYDKRFEAWNNA